MKKYFTLVAAMMLCILFAMPVYGYTDIQSGTNYIYSQDGKDVVIPDAYTFTKSIPVLDINGLIADSPLDMSVLNDGTIVVLDTNHNQVIIQNNDGSTHLVLSNFTMSDGSITTLNKPEGILAQENKTLLIADTQNNRILLSDWNGKIIQVITKPQNLIGVKAEDAFLPVKVDVDALGRIYIVARNINRGIICTDKNGLFIGYVGAPRVQPDIFEIMWRRFSTKAQKEQMTQYVSTEYNNVVVDDQNFIWGTISALDINDIKSTISSKDKSGKVTPISKINSGDIDVLKRNGFYPPIGDLSFKDEQSRIIDVGLGNGGVYSLLDYQRGRIFTYDDNGNMLFTFGEIGNKNGSFKNPVAIVYQGDNILVLDSILSEIMVFEPTSYGKLVLQAVKSQFDGDYDNAYQQWTEVAKNNSNFEYAFIGMGNVCVSEKKYDQAMKYFKYADDKELYSAAFELMRKEKMEVYFPAIFFTIGLLIVLGIFITIGKRIAKYIKG